jgi:hypothetical protein
MFHHTLSQKIEHKNHKLLDVCAFRLNREKAKGMYVLWYNMSNGGTTNTILEHKDKYWIQNYIDRISSHWSS